MGDVAVENPSARQAPHKKAAPAAPSEFEFLENQTGYTALKKLQGHFEYVASPFTIRQGV